MLNGPSNYQFPYEPLLVIAFEKKQAEVIAPLR